MEVQENVEPNVSTREIETKPKKEKKDFWVIVLNIFLAIITIILLGYIAYKNGYIDLDNILNIQKETEQEEITDEEEAIVIPEPEDLVLTVYEGQALTAILLDDWEIEEYFNGEGTTMMAGETDFTGLTGLRILHGNKEIMRIEAVSGIGFLGCPQLPRFADSSPTYEQEMEELNEITGENIIYLNYTNTLFSEFDFFEYKTRRVETEIYFDKIDGNEYFEPQCETQFFRWQSFGFTDSNGFTGDSYMYTISQSATEDELEVLDQILASMEVV